MKSKGDGSITVCDRRRQEWRLYKAKWKPKEIAEKFGISVSTVYKDLKDLKDEALAELKDKTREEFIAEAKDTYDHLMAEAWAMLAEAKEQKDYKSRATGMGIALDKLRLAQQSIDKLFTYTSIYEGDKSSVTVNVFQGFDESQWEKFAPGFLEHLAGDREDAQSLMDWLWSRGLRPALEGECEVVE